MFGQPTRANAQAAIGMALLAHDQLQHSVFRNRRNGVFAHAQGDERIDQCLGVQAHQMPTVLGQLATGECLCQGFTQPVELHHAVRLKAQAVEKVLYRPGALAWQDFDQITRLPRVAVVGCAKPQQVRAGTEAAGVEPISLFQRPVAVTRGLPWRAGRATGELAQLLLPLLQCQGIAVVDVHRAEQRLCAALV